MENYNEKLTPVMSLKDWIITIIISYIPIVGLIMLFVWAFSSTGINENKKNWAKALLVIQLVGMALIVLIYVFIIGSVLALYKANS